jgi:hypothetical protein
MMLSSRSRLSTASAARGALLAVCAALTIGSLLLAVAHTGVRVPLLEVLGPRGGAVPIAASGFAVGALLHGLAFVGIARQRAWGWAVGLVIHGLTLAAAAFPFRGAGSVLGIGLSVLGLVLLMTPDVRHSLLPR